MKNFVLILLTTLLTVSVTWAGSSVTYVGQGYTGTQFIPGVGNVYAGEMKYIAQSIAGVQDGPFVSFCIEVNEHVYKGVTYDAFVNPNNEAVHGGIGGGDPDPLSSSTAWLYNDYLNNYVGTSNTLAKDYQLAVWYLEEEISQNLLTTNAQALVDNALLYGSNWNNNTIKVLNLYENYGTCDETPSQDCMVRIDPVPAPGALLIGSMGMIMVSWLRRRHQNLS